MVEDSEFIKVEISSFLFNAGIVGLHYLLQSVKAQEGVDYRVEQNALLVAKSFMAKRDLTQDYINAHIKKFADDAAFTHISEEIAAVTALTEKYRAGDESAKKILDEKYKYILNSTGLARNSYFSAMTSLADQGYYIDLKEECKKIKDIKDYQEKYQQLTQLKALLAQPTVKETLLMKDIIYSRINSLWSNKAFLNMANSKKNIYNIFEKDFIAPLKKSLLEGKKITNKKAKNCIECDCVLGDSVEISFLNDTADDMTRKRSSFWNYKPDTYLCPFCAFVYVLAPLGFDTLGKDLIFINANTSVQNLANINDAAGSVYVLESKNKENEKYQLILHRIVQEVIKGKLKEQKNIQVIVRDKINERYKFSIIAKDILEVLQKSIKQLESLAPYAIEISPKNWLNIYQAVFMNIVNRSNQYGLLNLVLRHSLKENTRTAYLMMVIEIQRNMLGGKDVERKNADNAFYRGRDLRGSICGDKAGTKDADNKLRGFVYQLLNALQTHDQEKFWYLVMKMYAGLCMPVPQIFLETFDSEEELQYLGYAFILGLKNEKYVAENKSGEVAVNE